MKMSNSKQKLFALAAVLAILVGGTLAAVTAGKGSAREKRGPLVTAASYLGVSTSQLHSELQSGRSLAQIANATSGKSSSGLVALLLADGKERLAAAQARLPKRIAALVNRVAVPGQRAAAASYLGLKRGQLASELRSGKTLAQIAGAIPGKSVAGLIEAIVAARKSLLEARVAAGTLTQAQANARLAHLTSHVTAAVNRIRAKPRG
jgi:hypothetical protein